MVLTVEDMVQLAVRVDELKRVDGTWGHAAVVAGRSDPGLVAGARDVLLRPELGAAPLAVEVLVDVLVRVRPRDRPP